MPFSHVALDYQVLVAPRFRRLAKKLTRQHPEFSDHYARAVRILSEDPTNNSNRFSIKKLRGVSHGNGQWRLRLGRFRVRYDVYAGVREVLLTYCAVRREGTYKR